MIQKKKKEKKENLAFLSKSAKGVMELFYIKKI